MTSPCCRRTAGGWSAARPHRCDDLVVESSDRASRSNLTDVDACWSVCAIERVRHDPHSGVQGRGEAGCGSGNPVIAPWKLYIERIWLNTYGSGSEHAVDLGNAHMISLAPASRRRRTARGKLVQGLQRHQLVVGEAGRRIGAVVVVGRVTARSVSWGGEGADALGDVLTWSAGSRGSGGGQRPGGTGSWAEALRRDVPDTRWR